MLPRSPVVLMYFCLCPKTVPAPEASPAIKPREAGSLLPPCPPPLHHFQQCPYHKHHGDNIAVLSTSLPFTWMCHPHAQVSCPVPLIKWEETSPPPLLLYIVPELQQCYLGFLSKQLPPTQLKAQVPCGGPG